MKKKLILLGIIIICNLGFAVDLKSYVEQNVVDIGVAETIYTDIMRFSEKYSVDPALVASVIKVESNYDSEAISEKGALGLMQVMPFHFHENEIGISISDNINRGTKILSLALKNNNGDIALALAEYNAGAGAVEKYGIPPYAETENYIFKVIELYNKKFEKNYKHNPIKWNNSTSWQGGLK